MDDRSSSDLYRRYLRILGVPRRRPDLAALTELTSAHLRRVPFENVSKLYHRRNDEMRLPGLARFLDGVERQHFGGTCYSNNYHLHGLLAHLGYRVSLCGADMSAPDMHVVNTVDLAGRPYLVDVGYGAPFASPLPLDLERDHEVRWGSDRYVLKPRDSAGRSRLELHQDGRLRHGYQVNPRPRRIQEFAPIIAASFEESATFMNALLLARFFPGRSVTLRNLTLCQTRAGSRGVSRILGRDVLPAAVERYFGIPEAITLQALEGIALSASVWGEAEATMKTSTEATKRGEGHGPNPWLSIPAADYLGHMGSSDVDQLSVLAGILRGALDRHRPRTLLVLGCSTGIGFEHIDPAVTRRVTGVDINAEYLDQLRCRFPRPEFELGLRCQDVADYTFPRGEFDLVHCALLFEYVQWRPLLPKVAWALRRGGSLSLVLQRPSPTVPAVTPSAFSSLRRLESLFRFVDVEALLRVARPLGLALWKRHEVVAKQGKAFLVLELRREGRECP